MLTDLGLPTLRWLHRTTLDFYWYLTDWLALFDPEGVDEEDDE